MTTKHTPGPWKYRRIGARRGPVRLTDKTFVVTPEGGPAFAYLPEGRDDIQEANALVIAAAPELLEALQIWMKFFDTMPKGQFGGISCDVGLMNDGFIKSARAISKATGETK